MVRREFFMAPVAAMAAPAPKSLQEQVTKEIRDFPATVWLYGRNLDGGTEIAIRADEKVRTASTIKLPIMATVFDRVRSGATRWDELIPLRDVDKVSGSGVLHELSDGVKLPLRDLVRLMIVVSDNTATNLVLDRITADAVNEYMDKLGLPQTRSLRKVRGDGSQLKAASGWSQAGLKEENKKFGLGVSTSREMVRLMEMREKGEVVSAEASKEMLAVLGRQQFKDGIGRKLEKYPVASKSGSLDALRSDVALVRGPVGRVALAITVDGLKDVDYSEDNAGLLLIARLGEMIATGLR